MVRFARVDGVVTPAERGSTREVGAREMLRLVVTLDDGKASRVVRAETLPALRPIESSADLDWHADQWTQETIGVDLAEEGWEPVSLGESADLETPGMGRSQTYIVRKL